MPSANVCHPSRSLDPLRGNSFRCFRLLSAGLDVASAPLLRRALSAATRHRRTRALAISAQGIIMRAIPVVENGTLATTREAQRELFRDEGEYWQILYEGKCLHIQSLKGLFYLRHLLQHPDDKIHVSSLAALGDHYSRPGRSTADRGLDVPPDPPLLAHDLG